MEGITDWRSRLVQSQAQLQAEFYNWLNHRDLLALRSAIAKTLASPEAAGGVELFITCDPMDLDRLPWETWEMAREFAVVPEIRIARSPMNLPAEGAGRSRKGKLRLLAIMGDDTGLDFKAERAAIAGLKGAVTVEFCGWNGKVAGLLESICDRLKDPQGWDIVFFAGHSNETKLTGGELAIAPGYSVLITELLPALQQAKAQGLRFAMFNSCSGLSIANALVNAGLGQVAIFREPIHNQVASEFLIQFVQRLIQGADVHQSMIAACEFLKCDRHITYPSAFLVPSLFRHPESQLLKPPLPMQWRALLPETRTDRVVLASALLLSCLGPVRSTLLDFRVAFQALYRDTTGQLAKTPPPIKLVQIDRQSIAKPNGPKPVKPIDRRYIAKLIDRLPQAKTIAIDYFFDEPNPQDGVLKKKLGDRAATTFILGESLTQANYVLPPGAATFCVRADRWYMTQLGPQPDCQSQTPLPYALAASLKSPIQHREFPLTQFMEAWFQQPWLRPIIDFSVPPGEVYQVVPAWQLLEQNLELSPQQVVLIGANYKEAGVDEFVDYETQIPRAIAYWQGSKVQARFTGAEALAYRTHHWLNDRFVVPIPDLWMVALVGAIGRGLQVNTVGIRRRWLLLGNLAYGILSFQLYITSGVLLPWLLPGMLFCYYGLGFRPSRLISGVKS
ncbi:MAG: CHASE2 domain-containing protein [Alkalinema sp. RU_4_3]|nr:CHASE2 domain-containing protein [Alkalinema sp. RU_4_3]